MKATHCRYITSIQTYVPHAPLPGECSSSCSWRTLPFLFGAMSRGLDWSCCFRIQAGHGRSPIWSLLTNVLFGFCSFSFPTGWSSQEPGDRCLLSRLAGILVVALVSPPAARRKQPYRSNSIRAQRDQRLNQDGNELDQFGSHGDQQFLPAGDLAGCPDQPGESDGDANDRPVQKSDAEHFQHQPKSATLPNPVALENVMRNHQTNDFGGLTSAYGNTYGNLPTATAASPATAR